MTMKRWNGSAYVDVSSMKRWNETAYIETKGKRWNGSAYEQFYPNSKNIYVEYFTSAISAVAAPDIPIITSVEKETHLAIFTKNNTTSGMLNLVLSDTSSDHISVIGDAAVEINAWDSSETVIFNDTGMNFTIYSNGIKYISIKISSECNQVTVDFGNDKINGLYMNIPHIAMYDSDNYDINHDYSTSGNIYELIEDMGLTSGDAFRATYKPLFPANVYIPYTFIRLYMNAYDGNTFSNHTEDSDIDFYYINNNHNMRHIDIFSNTTTCVLSSDRTVSNIYPLRDLDDFTLGYFSQDYPITIYACISNCVKMESYLYTSLYLSLKL